MLPPQLPSGCILKLGRHEHWAGPPATFLQTVLSPQGFFSAHSSMSYWKQGKKIVQSFPFKMILFVKRNYFQNIHYLSSYHSLCLFNFNEKRKSLRHLFPVTSKEADFKRSWLANVLKYRDTSSVTITPLTFPFCYIKSLKIPLLSV